MKGIWKGVSISILFVMLTLASWNFAQEKDEVLGKVGNEVITRADFEARLKSFPASDQQKMRDVEKRRQLLDNIIKSRLIVVEAMNRGLAEKPELKARLKILRDQAIGQEYIEDYLSKKAEISDKEAEDFYNNHPDIRDRELLKVSQ